MAQYLIGQSARSALRPAFGGKRRPVHDQLEYPASSTKKATLHLSLLPRSMPLMPSSRIGTLRDFLCRTHHIMLSRPIFSDTYSRVSKSMVQRQRCSKARIHRATRRCTIFVGIDCLTDHLSGESPRLPCRPVIHTGQE